MQLIYRGQSFPYQPHSTRVYRQPTAVNWRYQIQGETYGTTATYPRVLVSSPPAVNWRYHLYS